MLLNRLDSMCLTEGSTISADFTPRVNVMADKRDYYEVLDIDKSATQKQVKDAYRRLARKLHPDVNPDPNAADKFKEVGEAYEVLSNADKRAQYDRFGHAAFQPGQGAGPGPGGFPGGMTIDLEDLFGSMGGGQRGGTAGGSGGFGDIFAEMFGAASSGRGRSRSARPGHDLQYVVDLSLEDAARGTKKQLKYHRHVTCPTCHGSGGAPGTQPTSCATCQGRGIVGERRGFMMFQQTCPTCHGAGQVNPVNCSQCAGRGVIEKEENLSVDIPPGVDNNSNVHFENMGEAGENGGPPGDLYIIARIAEHHFFVRKGDNLFCEVPITAYEAALGAKIKVPTLISGPTQLTVPAGISTGEQITLKGKGLPHLRGWGSGDQIVQIKVVTPSGLNKRQRDLFKELQDLDTSDVRKHLKVT
jgi:molecular chaperone DnaJ